METARVGGLYSAAHDAGNYHKTFACRPCGDKVFRMSNIHYSESNQERIMRDYRRPIDTKTPIGLWKMPCPVVTGYIQGDWYDACKFFLHWTLGFNRWRPFVERDDVSERFRSEIMMILCGWARPRGHIQALINGQRNTDPKFLQECRDAMNEVTDNFIQLQEELDTKICYHMYMWWKSGEMDLRYPDYFPALEGVKEGIARMRKAGGAVMPYVQALLFDASAPQYAQAKPYFIMGLDGQIVNPGPWERGRIMKSGGWGGMCFATEWWQNHLAGAIAVSRKSMTLTLFTWTCSTVAKASATTTSMNIQYQAAASSRMELRN